MTTARAGGQVDCISELAARASELLDAAPADLARAGRRALAPSIAVVKDFEIRPEEPADHNSIEEVVRAAFARHPDEVALLVERIRASENFEAGLTLIAEDESGVIGHVMLSWIGVDGGSRSRILNLSPMSVRPDRQRRGVGSALILDVLGRAEAAGEPAVIVEGIPAYLPTLRIRARERVRVHPAARDDSG